MNGAADGFRHLPIGYARGSTADQNPDHQIDALLRAGVDLHVIEQGIGTSTMAGRAMCGMPSVLAELQRELIVANTNDGLACARAHGRIGSAGARSPESHRRATCSLVSALGLRTPVAARSLLSGWCLG
ncbi:recombinase family protein [Streptomyces sp. RGM 3693]|uniref:recombinase family protein n=1 Tax=Streptomyces sp. RGM 3693 TaxID=3413284 RepID=UPI003D278C3F